MTYIGFWRSRLGEIIFHPLNFCLGFGIAFSFGLLFMRFHIAGNGQYLFLVWNLFLAGLLVASTSLKFLHESGKWKWYLSLQLIFFWLAFLPNAPYILTDLFHLRTIPPAPKWLDLMLILSFAWNGLMFGLISVMDMQEIFSQRWTRFTGWFVAIGALVASSFGIYLGRFLR
ncbi:MAG: putative membrane protein [Flavobacteriales bacterium]